jgi:uncharacterized phage protein gp47/JayE
MGNFVTAAGLEIKTVETILAELDARQKAEIDPNLNTAPDEPMGELNGIFAAQLREGWEVLQVAYNGFNPDATEGFLLEALCALTGTVRRLATKSTVTLDCDLDIATTLQAGVNYSSVLGDPDNRWTPVTDYTATVGGVQAVLFEAEEAGAVAANSGTITVIATAVVGWNSVTNLLDATVGRNEDSNTTLKERREEELRASGTATVDAMRADLLQVEDVEQAQVFENVTDYTDATGLPGKSIEVVVYDGSPPALTDDEIAQAIWDTKGAGVRTFGTDSGTATDSLGNFHTIYFSRPTEREIWLELDLDTNLLTGYVGEDAVKTAIVAKGLIKLLVGSDVIVNDYLSVAQQFDGVIDVTAIRAGFAVSPVGTINLVITTRELAVLDTSRIDITDNPIVPP